MSRRPSTRRSPCTGGRDVHVRVSAAEYAEMERRAAADGFTGRGAVARWLLWLALTRVRDDR